MDARQVGLVQESFVHVLPFPREAAGAFYDRLFAIAPEVRPLFRTDMEQQGLKLVMTLTAIVDGLDRLDALLPVARDLAIRHVRYGAQPHHYDAVGTALIDTLRHFSGDAWTAEIEAAWKAAYALLAGEMIAATRAVAA